MIPRHRLALILALAFIAVGSGCNEGRKARSLSAAMASYDAGRYEIAHEEASRAERSLTGPERERAAYLVGLSAYQLKRLPDAEQRFLVAAGSTNTEIAGKSNAMLGILRSDQGRHTAAAEYFKSASRLLEGPEAAEAAYRAGRAYELTGDWAAARTQFTIASSQSRPGETRRNADRGLAGTGFTLQVGAFRSRTNADDAARAARSTAERYGLGAVRVAKRQDELGRTLFLVQMGTFGTRKSAEREFQRIGDRQLLVTTVAD